ncbi:MAG: hypothetical protein GDA56_05515 [Hormoscilla sp. GM7CHS1pb]|nr:hypothetical protein [Hormoscilla sp. GM7CHS1pb]
MPNPSNNKMGKLFTNLTVINRADQIRAESGIISPEAIMSITFNKVLVEMRLHVWTDWMQLFLDRTQIS